jgi:hypothetical protein
MGISDAQTRQLRWWAAATDQAPPPARLTPDDVKRIQKDGTAFIEAIKASPSLEGARRLDRIAKSAREGNHIAMAVSLETLSAEIINTLRATADFVDQLSPEQLERFTR